MTRQKKTHLAILALVPAIVFAAVRCADSTGAIPPTVENSQPGLDAEVSATLARLHRKNDWVGQFHNDALGYVLVALNRLPAKARDRHSVCEASRKAYREFHKSRRGIEEPASVDIAFEQFCARGSSPRPSNAVVISTAASTPRAADALAAQQFMDRFLDAIDASVSYDDLSARINSIDAAAAGSLSADEAASVVIAGSIALSSADYWANNMPAWDPFVGTDTGFFSVLAMTRGDATGGIGRAAGISWGSVWNDAKAAAKRAAKGDVGAATKAIVSAGFSAVIGGPVTYEAVLAASATGSVMSVLGF